MGSSLQSRSPTPTSSRSKSDCESCANMPILEAPSTVERIDPITFKRCQCVPVEPWHWAWRLLTYLVFTAMMVPWLVYWFFRQNYPQTLCKALPLELVITLDNGQLMGFIFVSMCWSGGLMMSESDLLRGFPGWCTRMAITAFALFFAWCCTSQPGMIITACGTTPYLRTQ